MRSADFFRWLFSGFRSPGPTAPARPTAPSGSFDWNFGLGSLSNVFTIAMIVVIAVVADRHHRDDCEID